MEVERGVTGQPWGKCDLSKTNEKRQSPSIETIRDMGEDGGGKSNLAKRITSKDPPSSTTS